MGQTPLKERCGTRIDYEKLRKSNPFLYNYLQEINRKAAEYTQKRQRGQVSPQSIPNTATIVTIPVVVHVIHNGEAVGSGRNISDAQIQSQIDVLNEDYRRLNADRTNTPAEFAGVAADVGIQFRLACVDPNGNSTNGIRRVQGDQANYTIVFNQDLTINEASTGIKANDAAWNRNQYLNIWTASINGGTLGYGTLPGGAANVDGVVVQYNAFGRTGNLQSSYDKGRTATHEVGHWLSLAHIWGANAPQNSTDCNDTDDVADTPNQAGSYLGQCPSGQQFSCNVSNMYQNYMDYTNDACMNLFTTGQSDRMKSLFLPGNARDGFISWSDIAGNATICDNNTHTYSVNSTGTSFNWTVSGNLTITSGQGTSQITVVRAFNGPATVSVTSQGLCSSRSVRVGPPEIGYFSVNGQPTSNATVCVNNFASVETLPFDAAASYSWTLSNQGNAYLTNYFNANTAFNAYVADCYVLTLQASNVCGTTQASLTICAQNCFARYTVYPNPAKDHVTVEFESVTDAEALPDEITLVSEASGGTVRTVNVQETFSRKTFKNGNQIRFDVKDLPRGRYYVQVKNSRRKDKEVEVIRILLE